MHTIASILHRRGEVFISYSAVGSNLGHKVLPFILKHHRYIKTRADWIVIEQLSEFTA